MEEAPAVKLSDDQPFNTNYILDSITYEIKVTKDKNNLLIEVMNKSELENSIYLFDNSFSNIIKLDKYFMLFENIEEIKNNIVDILKSSENYAIKIENEKELKLILKPIIGTKIKNIEFSLTKKEIKSDNLINILIDKINSLEKENQILKDKLNEFQDLFKEEIQIKRDKKKFFEETKDILIGENIATIQKTQDFELIKNGINEQISEFKNKKLKLCLLYKASINGFTSYDFHKYCDGKGPTVSIIKTGDNYVFGGFLNVSWSNYGGENKDDKSFLFNLNLNKTYKNNGGCACNFNKEKGPYFGYAINIYHDFSGEMHCVRTSGDMKWSWKNVEKDYELNLGKENFLIKEIEVFQVIAD